MENLKYFQEKSLCRFSSVKKFLAKGVDKSRGDAYNDT